MAKENEETRAMTAALSNRLFFRLYQCANMLHKTGTRALERHRITTQQWAVLGALTRSPFENGVAVGDLAAFLLVSRQNLAGLLSRLEAQGLVEKVIDANDNRSRLIRLTEGGRALWQEDMQPAIAAYYADALQGFSTDDRIHLIHYLDKMLRNFKAIDPEAGDDAGERSAAE